MTRHASASSKIIKSIQRGVINVGINSNNSSPRTVNSTISAVDTSKSYVTEAGSMSFDYYTANWQGFTYPVWISSKPHAYLTSSTNVAGIVFNSGSPGSANKGARVAYEVVELF
jgi:hypothetical protein